MPNLDHTGPHGEGSETGKRLGFCNSSIEEHGLGLRLRQHNKGCKSKSQNSIDSVNFNNTEIIGMKRCHKKHHGH